jgi:gliding motility-associated lipoprotein GldD
MRQIVLAIAVVFFIAISCKNEIIPIPKPRVYPKVNYPERNYVKMDTGMCPFSFEYPDYMEYKQEKLSLNNFESHPCWFNLKFPSLNGDIHFTYTPLGPADSLESQLFKIYNDAYRMAQEHVSKANGIEDLLINNPEKGIYGVLFSLEGSVASTFQIVVTDSMHHAVRAALYFNNRPAPDSMAPVVDFLRTDMMGMLNSFEWEDTSVE